MLLVSSQPQQELFLKVLVVGDAGVGKTSFIRRYVDQEFTSAYRSTVGVDFAMTLLKWGNRNIRLQLWDIAGQERYTSMTRVYYKDAAAAIVVYDKSHPPSLKNVKKWKDDIDEKVRLPGDKPIPCILIANKADLPVTVSPINCKQDMDHICKEIGFRVWSEASAKTGANVNESVDMLLNIIITENPKLFAAEEATGRNSPTSPETVCVLPGRRKKMYINNEAQINHNHNLNNNSNRCCV